MSDEPGPLVLHPVMNAKIRSGSYLEHATSTYTLAEQALLEGRGADAAELARYTVQEALEAYELFTQWCREIPEYLSGRGIGGEKVMSDAGRLVRLQVMPDGSVFDGDAGWARYKALIEDFALHADNNEVPQALAALNEARNVWRDTHDRLCDGVYFWIDAAARHLGEDVTGELWDMLMSPMYDYYVRYDVDNHPWARSFDLLMHYALEGLRGHLSGPGRRGDVEVVEEADRWAIRFNPCGSGGRTMRDDPDTGTGPRIEPPYGFGVTTEPHDWSWNKKGICLYCVHCCQLNERMPIRRFGYPTRVVEPPVWPQARTGTKCTWYIYKDPALVPEEIYRRVGAAKPARLGSGAQRSAQSK